MVNGCLGQISIGKSDHNYSLFTIHTINYASYFLNTTQAL